jgi:hypothetical protein
MILLLKKIVNSLDGLAWALILFLVLGFFLRVYYISNDSLWIDEGYTIMQQRAISEHGYPLLMSGYKELKDVLLPYLLAAASLVGDDVAIFRLISAIFGTGSILLIFFIGKNLANKYIGLVSAFLMAFSYWHIAWSRQVRAYSMLVFFAMLTLFFIIKYEKNNKNKYLLLAFIAIIFSILAKSSSGMLILPAFIVYIFLKKKYELLVWCLGFGILLIIFFKKTLLDAMSGAVVNYSSYYLIGYYWKYFGIIFVTGLVGFYLAITQQIKYLHVHVFNAIYFFVPFIFFSFFSYVNQARYLFFTTPLIFLYAGYFIYYVASGFARKNLALMMILILLLIFGIDFLTVKSVQMMPKITYKLENYTPQSDFKSAYKFLENSLNRNDIVVSAYPYMDLIYLNRFNYALEISYTGRVDDSSLHNLHEFYTGAGSISSVDDIELKRNDGNVFIILDDMAAGRISADIFKYIRSEGRLIYEDNGELSQQMYVYELARE